MKILRQTTFPAAACALLFIITSCFISVPAVHAASYSSVSGEISSTTTWLRAESPYVISGAVFVDPDAVLTIQPGVVVKFMANSGLTVGGTLVASGTPAEPIYFTSIADDKAGGDTNKDKSASAPAASNVWAMDFINASSSAISNAIVRYSSGGIFVLNSSLAVSSTTFSDMDAPLSLDASSLSGKDLSFSYMNRGVLSAFGTSSVVLSSVSVTHSTTDAVAMYANSALSADSLSVSGENAGAGLTIFNSGTASCDHCAFSNIANNGGPSVSVYSSSSLSLTNSSIENATGTSATAFEIYDPPWQSATTPHSRAVISGGIFRGGRDGILVFGPVALNLDASTISGFSDDGIQAYDDADISALTDTISKNQNAGIEMWQTVSGSIADSYFTGNGSYGIESRTPSPFMAADNWWGSASGPYHPELNPAGSGNIVSDNVTFSPWLKNRSIRIAGPENEPEPCCSSVLFLPGLEASRLYASSSTSIVALIQGTAAETQLWEPGLTTDISKLFLNMDGSSASPIYTKDIIKETDELSDNIDIYQSFSNMLDALAASGTIAAWQAYPYDWRLDPRSLVRDGTQLADIVSKLEPMVLALAGQSKTGKVSIIAHSNGGILAKLLLDALKADGNAGLVDSFIMVAVPQLGTPIAIPALLSGYGQSLGSFPFTILNESNAQQLAENMQSAYDLIPSAAYLAAADPVVELDPSLAAISNLYKIYGSVINTAPALASFLVGSADHRASGQPLLALANPALLSNAVDTHAQLDAWQAPSGVRVIQVAGIGVDTLSSTRYYARPAAPDGHATIDMSPQMTMLGDGAVVASSAVSGTAKPSATYYVDLGAYNLKNAQNRSHTDIFEASPVQELLSSLLQESAISLLPDFVSTSIPAGFTHDSNEEISVHSPVTLDVYDSQGRHTGPTGGLQEQIPNSYYMPFGEGQYTAVPLGTEGKIVLSGTAVGFFTLDIRANGTTTEFSDIPVLPVSIASLALGTSSPSIAIDFDGDGTVDAVFSASAGFDPISYLTAIQKLIDSFGLPTARKNNLENEIQHIIAAIKKGAKARAKKSILKYMNRPILTKVHGRLSAADQQTILSALDSVYADLCATPVSN